MNGIFNNNFLIGFLLAKDLPRNEALTVGLTSGMFPQNNMVGPLLLKPQIDTRIDLETKNTSLQGSLNTVKSELATASLPLEMDLSSGTTAMLRIKGATKSTFGIEGSPQNGFGITPVGELTVGREGQATILVEVDGVPRRIIVNVKKNAPLPQ